ncbi:WD40 repeat-like protein [Stereum hirsutum FP-91666 SS1]|uniref:WD40 repeat-like protein n=1 Tax=Stereum hirsutum (strain FP-91666) TaxID=721885 RepID=UPI000440F4CF|nr:WD40 repeat-like protein [Stereum hirsutum FP-91666 SS1]EIM87905.1 WD40 repeat-like protein [Stereum hirsutum FP-91666 SS1]
MSSSQKEEEGELQAPQRPPSPPPHTTFSARGVHAPNFSAFRPRDVRIPSHQGMNHVAWSCDGKKLAAAGMDKAVRIWQPDKSLDTRGCSLYSISHSDDTDYVSWNPTHPELFCSSSSKERRIVFWDARQSKPTQIVNTRSAPIQTNYSPDGKHLVWVSVPNQLHFLSFAKPEGDDGKEQWGHMTTDTSLTATTAMFNHVGDGLILTHISEYQVRIHDFPALTVQESLPAHVGGCIAAALDPRGKYMASGGYDTIVNIFDMDELICARTITACEHSVTALSFSHCGEYIAISNIGKYIDICAVETGAHMHRIKSVSSSPTVAWHPSRHAIAYCGQVAGPPSVAAVSLFGPGV